MTPSDTGQKTPFSSQLKGASQQVLAGGAFCGGFFFLFLEGDPRVRISGAHLCARRARPAGGAPGPAQVDPAPLPSLPTADPGILSRVYPAVPPLCGELDQPIQPAPLCSVPRSRLSSVRGFLSVLYGVLQPLSLNFKPFVPKCCRFERGVGREHLCKRFWCKFTQQW